MDGIQASAASRAQDCGNPPNLVALAQIRVDRAPDGTRNVNVRFFREGWVGCRV